MKVNRKNGLNPGQSCLAYACSTGTIYVTKKTKVDPQFNSKSDVPRFTSGPYKKIGFKASLPS